MPLSLNLVCRDYRETLPFVVEVLDHAIDHLVADAQEAYRVYELMMIRRPGDVWKYLWVRLIEVPDSVIESLVHAKKDRFPYRRCDWPDSHVPLVKFDSLFYWCGNDTTEDSEAWLKTREGKNFAAFGDGLFDRVRAVQATLRSSGNVLIQTELDALDHHLHHHDHDTEPPYELTTSEYQSPTLPKRRPAYYEKLAELLARPDVRMMSSLGDEDYQTLRMIAEAQRRRALANGKTVCEALPFHILTDGVPSLRRWNASFLGWQEGLGYADLLLDGDRSRGFSFFTKRPGDAWRLALTHRSGVPEIPGFTKTEGDGWVLYEDKRPNIDYAQRIQRAFDEYVSFRRQG